MKIEQLQHLIKIIEKGSMNEAAKELYIARSSLSSSMKSLENEFGGRQILERHSKGVYLTPFGSNVYAQAKEIVNRIDFLQNISETDKGNKLRIGSMYCSMANDALAQLLASHYKENLDVILEETSCINVINLVGDGFYEIGIVTLFEGTEHIFKSNMEDKDIEWHEMTKRQLGAMVGPKNPLYDEYRNEITLDELKVYPHLENYATPTELPWEQVYGSTGEYRNEYLVSDLGIALRLVEETDAVLIDSYDNEIYRNLYKHCDFKFIPLVDYPECKTGWIKKRDFELSHMASEFIKIFTQLTDKAI